MWGAHTKRSTHLLTGIAIGAVISSLLDREIGLLVIGGAAGMLPDLDLLFVPLYRKAHRSPWSHSLGSSASITAAWLLVLLVASPWFEPELTDVISVSASGAVVFFASFAHAAEDALTRYGCRLFHPLSRRTIRGPFKYDDVAANAVLSMLSLTSIILFVLIAL